MGAVTSVSAAPSAISSAMMKKSRTLVVRDLGRVGALDLVGDADETPAERVLGRSVQHLLLDLCLVRRPRVEADLVPLAAVLLVLKVVHGVPRRVGREVVQEVVVRRRVGLLLDLDLGVVGRQLEYDVLGLCAAAYESARAGFAVTGEGDVLFPSFSCWNASRHCE